MNIRAAIVLFIGMAIEVLLVIFPPWKAHGVYSGHFRVDRVAWMEPDHTRLLIEMLITLIITVLLTLRYWKR